MVLKEKIQEDLTTVLREKKELELSVLRMLLSAVNNKETEKKTKIWKAKPELSPEKIKKEGQLTDEEIFEVIASEIKKEKNLLNYLKKGKGRIWLIKRQKKKKF